MKHYILIMSMTIASIAYAEAVKINVYPTVTYNQRIDITNKNTGALVPPMTPLATAQPIPVTPTITLLTENPIISYSMLKKCCIPAALITTATYFTSLSYLISQARSLRQDTHWYNWKQEVPLAALRELPQEQIMQTLGESLHKKYGAVKDVFTISAILQTEEQELKRIISYCSWIKKYRMSFLFFYQDCIVELAKQKLERLLFIKEILAKHITFIKESPSIHEGAL